MVQPIMRSQLYLRQPSEEAGEGDLQIAQDLADTLEAHRAGCVGMAANMIGQRKRIIAVMDERGEALVMLNPRIIRQQGPYQAEEGCLSLAGVRPATRYRRITVAWQDTSFCDHEQTFKGDVAQAIQPELDHCDGVLI